TLWVGIIAMPFQNLAAFGTDQLNTQRMFCCKNESEARLAIIWSSLSQAMTVLMLLVGAGLAVYYQQYTLSTEARELLTSSGNDYIFPIWITTVLPIGLSGLVLAGAFAAAISSLDSILAALSQSTLSLIYGDSAKCEKSNAHMLQRSRITIIIWGTLLPLFAIFLYYIKGQIDMLNLAFGMVTYTYGPLLGILILALSKRKICLKGIWIGIALSLLTTLLIRPDFYNVFNSIFASSEIELSPPKFSYAWLYPITCIITVLCGCLFIKKNK
ncbi:MAG: hypothetical protein AAF984_10900, partial [Verrucomicrobiota bacterium]